MKDDRARHTLPNAARRSCWLTFRSFLTGPGRYLAASPWPVVAAIPVAVLILAGAQAFAAVALKPVFGIDADTLTGLWPSGNQAYRLDPAAHRGHMALLVLSQGAVIALTLAMAIHGGAGAVLKLARPAEGWSTLLYGLIGMVPLIAVFNVAASVLVPEQAAKDFAAFQQIAKAPSFLLTAIAVGLGASLSEELLFRGFLLTPLARTRLGFWPAALLATLGWTALHFGYSWLGLLEVFLFGLYFSWLLWRSGSLWPPLVCHAVYNSGLLAVLRLWPG